MARFSREGSAHRSSAAPDSDTSLAKHFTGTSYFVLISAPIVFSRVLLPDPGDLPPSFRKSPDQREAHRLGRCFHRVTMQVFGRDHFQMIAAPVQCDVDGIPKGSHGVSVSPIKVKLAFALHALLPRRFRFTRLGEAGVGDLDLAAALIVRDHEARSRDSRSSQLVAVRR
jgi:hypothetical protein